MTVDIEDRYLSWLLSRIRNVRTRQNRVLQSQRDELLALLHRIEYTWTVLGDDNRLEYAVEMRFEFCSEKKVARLDDEWLYSPCSVLELLISLAREAASETDTPTHQWFELFLKNLGLITDDGYFELEPVDVEDIVNRFVDREYTSHGVGGLFPLVDPSDDQRNVQLWYQLSAYLIENHLV